MFAFINQAMDAPMIVCDKAVVDDGEGHSRTHVKREKIAKALIEKYKSIGLEPPLTLLEMAHDISISKRSWESAMWWARSELRSFEKTGCLSIWFELCWGDDMTQNLSICCQSLSEKISLD